MKRASRENMGRQARILRWLTYGAMLILAAAELPHVLALDFGSVRVEAAGIYDRLPSEVATVLRAGTIIAWLLSFWFLSLSLRPLERGELFTASVTRNLRRFAGFLVVALAIPALLVPLAGYFADSCPASGPCFKYIAISFRTLLMLVVAILFFLVAGLLDEGRRIEDDNRQIV